jgi:Flp pilus assembly protein TadG
MSARIYRGGLAAWLIRYLRDRRGAISPMMVMALVPLIGAMAMGTEATNWWLVQRQAQNAADSAAIAAANNGSVNGLKGDSGGTSCTVVGDWCNEANGTTSKYGFANGSNGTVVNAQASSGLCPAGISGTCFQVSINRTVPVTLLSVVGFRGSQGNGNQLITASATAYSTGGNNNNPTDFCIIALGTAVTKDLTVNGGPNSDLGGCAIGSNGGTICNGANGIPGVSVSYAAPGDQNDCAPTATDDVPLRSPITDPYAGDASNLPTNPCSSYSQESAQNKISQLPATVPSAQAAQNIIANQLSGTISGTKFVCGDAGLAGNVSLADGAVLVVVNGWVDLGSFNMGPTATAGTSTIIFEGTASAAPFGTDHKGNPVPANPPFITGNTGTTLTINHPTSGTWNGFAVFTDPNTSDVPASSFNVAGNAPTYAVDGLYYSPHASVTISGTVGSNSKCIGFLVDTFIVNGTGNIIEAPSCPSIPLSSNNEGFLAGVVELVR